MSGTVLYKGKLLKVDLGELTLCEKVHELCRGSKWYDEYKDETEDLDEMICECTDSFLLLNNELYTYTRENFEDSSIFNLKLNDDGSMDYIVRYYNGGCGFEEAIETAMDRYNRNLNNV